MGVVVLHVDLFDGLPAVFLAEVVCLFIGGDHKSPLSLSGSGVKVSGSEHQVRGNTEFGEIWVHCDSFEEKDLVPFIGFGVWTENVEEVAVKIFNFAPVFILLHVLLPDSGMDCFFKVFVVNDSGQLIGFFIAANEAEI